MSMHQSKTLSSQGVLAKLASNNPQAFEALRSELIENCISSTPEGIQPRLPIKTGKITVHPIEEFSP